MRKKNQRENIIFRYQNKDSKLNKFFQYKNEFKANHPIYRSKKYI